MFDNSNYLYYIIVFEQIYTQNSGIYEIEIHHPDYNSPYKVHLLCRKHHMDAHNYSIPAIPVIDLEEYKRS